MPISKCHVVSLSDHEEGVGSEISISRTARISRHAPNLKVSYVCVDHPAVQGREALEENTLGCNALCADIIRQTVRNSPQS